MDVFNAAGLPVGLSWQLDVEHETALPVQLGHLPGGIYFAVLRTETERAVLQFLKI